MWKTFASRLNEAGMPIDYIRDSMLLVEKVHAIMQIRKVKTH